MLDQERDLEVVAVAADGAAAVTAALRWTPDVIVVDWPSVGVTGAQAVRTAVSSAGLTCAVVALVDDLATLADLDPVGAEMAGVLVKDVVLADELVRAIRRVSTGGTVIDPQLLANRTGRSPADGAGVGAGVSAAVAALIGDLTPRQREVLARLGEPGVTNMDIAKNMTISPETVKSHIRNLMRTLGLDSKADAVRLACRLPEQQSPVRGSSPGR